MNPAFMTKIIFQTKIDICWKCKQKMLQLSHNFFGPSLQLLNQNIWVIFEKSHYQASLVREASHYLNKIIACVLTWKLLTKCCIGTLSPKYMPLPISCKVQLFWEGHKNVRNRPYGFEIYLVNVKTIRTIALFFVAFSE